MPKVKRLNKELMLEKLPKIQYDKEDRQDNSFYEKTNLESALLTLAEIDQEHEYLLCKSIAAHLLSKVPEPEEINMDEE